MHINQHKKTIIKENKKNWLKMKHKIHKNGWLRG